MADFGVSRLELGEDVLMSPRVANMEIKALRRERIAPDLSLLDSSPYGPFLNAK